MMGGECQRVRGIEKKEEERGRTHGYGPQCGDSRGEEWVEVEEGLEGTNSDGKIKLN